MVNNELEYSIMQIIMNSGNAKSLAMEAIRASREGKFESAKSKLEEAKDAINLAHLEQTKLLTLEARGQDFNISLLMTHSQDHLMNSMTTLDLAEEIISLWLMQSEKGVNSK